MTAEVRQQNPSAPPVYSLAGLFILGMLTLLTLPAIRSQSGVAATIAATAGALALWLAALWYRERQGDGELTVSIVAVKAHWVQACAQMAVYAFWGWYWRPVYEHIPLLVAQLLLVYSVDMLLSLTRRRKWVLGFGPFPIILSTNLFLLFKPEWFYLQFAMLALGVFGKEFIRWNRDGRDTHIFNPSALGLFVFSIWLLATGSTEITWAEEIATTLNRPPHIYLYIFVLGLVVQALFSVTLVTLWAALALIALNLIYTQVTGVYYFFDSYIPIAVFLGLHLLVTDPATSPDTNLGKVMFGAGYGVTVFALYGLLEMWGMPRFYDKLLCVPLLNLLVPVFDWIARSVDRKAAWTRRFHTGNRLHMAVWIAVFAGMLGSGFVGAGHPGNDKSFWQEACADNRRNACENLIILHTEDCSAGSAADCFEVGRLSHESGGSAADPVREGSAFARACDLGYAAGCRRFAEFAAAGGDEVLRTDCEHGVHSSCYALGNILVYGIGREPQPAAGMEFWDRSCQLGWARACGDLGESLLFGTAEQPRPEKAATALQAACDGGYMPGCANLGLMYLRGRGVPRDQLRGRELLRQSCDAGLEAACTELATDDR